MTTNQPPRTTLAFGRNAAWPGTAVLVMVLLGSGWLWAADEQPQAARADEVWLISTRQVTRCTAEDARPLAIHYRRLGPDGTWLDADEEAFLAADDPAVPTCIFIHGNRETRQSAVRTGMTTYRRLFGEEACAQQRSLRFVIWSWPSEQVCRRNHSDLQVKAARSDREAYLLARLLKRIRPDVSVSLVGYSFGARAVTGALEMLGGGRVAGRKLAGSSAVSAETVGRDAQPATPRAAARPRLRAVLVAAAVANDWLLPGHRDGLALEQLDALLVTRNACDPVLRWYPRLYGRGGPGALGYTGPVCASRLGDQRQKLDLVGVTCSVGKNHSWLGYLCSGSLRARLEQYVFAGQSEPQGQAEASVSHPATADSDQLSALSNR